MCTSENILGKCVPAMAQAIISMCSRTWSQERRIGVLLRTIEPPLSVWDCVPEQIIDAHLKDAFEYLPDQRDYILFYAIPGSAVVRSIRRLDGHRATPLVLKSLHFAKEEDIDAYNFPEELNSTPYFSESDYGEDSTITRESTPLPTSVSEFDDEDIHTTTQDEEIRGKPQQWSNHLESDDVVVCTTPQDLALDIDDRTFSPKPRQLSPILQTHPEIDEDHQDDESHEAKSPKPRESFTIDECDEEFDEGQQNNEPLKTNSPEPHNPSPVHQSVAEARRFFSFRHESPIPEFDNDEKDDELLEADSPEPRRLFPVHRSHSALNAPLTEPDEEMKPYCMAPLRRFLTPQSQLEFDLFEERFVYMSENTLINSNPKRSSSEIPNPESRELFPLRHESHVAEYDDVKNHDEPSEAKTPTSRQFYLTSYTPPQLALQLDIFCPRPVRQYPTHKVIVQPELFEDWHVDMSEPIFIDEKASSPAQSAPFPFRPESPVSEYEDVQSCDESAEAEGSAYRNFYLTSYTSPKPAPKMDIFCPQPIRQYPTHKVIVQPKLFEDWHVDMGEPVFIDEKSMNPEHSVSSETSCDEIDDEAHESIEYIPLESLNLGF